VKIKDFFQKRLKNNNFGKKKKKLQLFTQFPSSNLKINVQTGYFAENKFNSFCTSAVLKITCSKVIIISVSKAT